MRSRTPYASMARVAALAMRVPCGGCGSSSSASPGVDAGSLPGDGGAVLDGMGSADGVAPGGGNDGGSVRLFFSDLESGPGSGGQGGKGAFVTVWGNGFGAARGGGRYSLVSMRLRAIWEIWISSVPP